MRNNLCKSSFHAHTVIKCSTYESEVKCGTKKFLRPRSLFNSGHFPPPSKIFLYTFLMRWHWFNPEEWTLNIPFNRPLPNYLVHYYISNQIRTPLPGPLICVKMRYTSRTRRFGVFLYIWGILVMHIITLKHM